MFYSSSSLSTIVNPLLDVGLPKYFPSFSIFSFLTPIFLCHSLYVIYPSSLWSSPSSLGVLWFPLHQNFRPSFIHSRNVSYPLPFQRLDFCNGISDTNDKCGKFRI